MSGRRRPQAGYVQAGSRKQPRSELVNRWTPNVTLGQADPRTRRGVSALGVAGTRSANGVVSHLLGYLRQLAVFLLTDRSELVEGLRC